MVSSSVKDSFHSPFPPAPSLVFLRPLMSHTHTQNSSTRRQPHQAHHHKEAATISSKPSFLLGCKLVHKLCKSEAHAEGKLLSLALARQGLHLPSGSSLGHWDGVLCTDASSCMPQGPTGLVFAPPGASCPRSNDTSVCCSSAAASPPVPEQSCVKHADVLITELMAALRACA